MTEELEREGVIYECMCVLRGECEDKILDSRVCIVADEHGDEVIVTMS